LWIFDEIHKYRQWRNYLKAKFPQAEAWQLSAIGRKDYVSEEGIRVAPALALLQDWVWKIARKGFVCISC